MLSAPAIGARRRRHRGRAGSIALEFALTAPLLIILVSGLVDAAIYSLIREQIRAAAEAIAQAAEKLAVPTNGTLTAVRMQNAMSTVYAEIPGLALGSGTGLFGGAFSVTLSGVAYLPLCARSAGCTAQTKAAQTPYTLWSSFFSEGGVAVTRLAGAVRPCGKLSAVSQFPDDFTQFTKMIDPSLVAGAGPVILAPQVVADVQYVFTPIFSTFFSPVTLWASASLPASVGGTDQEITLDSTAPVGNVVSCATP